MWHSGEDGRGPEPLLHDCSDDLPVRDGHEALPVSVVTAMVPVPTSVAPSPKAAVTHWHRSAPFRRSPQNNMRSSSAVQRVNIESQPMS